MHFKTVLVSIPIPLVGVDKGMQFCSCIKTLVTFQDCTLRLWNIENANEIPMVIEAIKTRGSKLAKVSTLFI